MEYLTNSERRIRNAKSAKEAGKFPEERKIDPKTSSFACEGNLSTEDVRKSFRNAAKKQLSGKQG